MMRPQEPDREIDDNEGKKNLKKKDKQENLLDSRREQRPHREGWKVWPGGSSRPCEEGKPIEIKNPKTP